MKENGETIYGTEGSPFAAQSWGTSTRKGNRLFLHVMTPENNAILVPGNVNIRKAFEFKSGKKVRITKAGDCTVVHLPEHEATPDFIIECEI